jgi:hypothetical protein
MVDEHHVETASKRLNVALNPTEIEEYAADATDATAMAAAFETPTKGHEPTCTNWVTTSIMPSDTESKNEAVRGSWRNSKSP